MWPKAYKDYRKDEEMIKYPVETGKGIKGCEMHEFYGWGPKYERPKAKKGILQLLLEKFKRNKRV